MARLYVRKILKNHPQQTAGASLVSPTQLVSGTAAVVFVPDTNTASSFPGGLISISLRFGVKPADFVAGRREAVVAKKSSRKPKRDETGSTANAAQPAHMMPAFAARAHQQKSSTFMDFLREMNSVNTPIRAKADEEMSELEREYPW